MKVGFHSPMPPARSGIADYSAALLPLLRRYGQVELGASAADIHLYQVGNNPLHAAIVERAIHEPGVVVLHDALLQHLFLHTLSETAYIDEFRYNYGAWGEDLARDLFRARGASGLRDDYYRYPMLKRLLEASRAVIVHNPGAAAIARRHAPATPVVEIPHLFSGSPAVSVGDALEFRRRLGIETGDFVFAIFGYLRESKRIQSAIRAFRYVREAFPATRLLLAGDFLSDDLPRSIAPDLRDPGFVHTGHLPDTAFWRAAHAVDCCLNLRYPSAGETSGVAIRLMGIGKPVIVSDGRESSGFPEGISPRIETGFREDAMLTGVMLWLRGDPLAARRIGQLAAAHIEDRHDPERVAEAYWQVLEQTAKISH